MPAIVHDIIRVVQRVIGDMQTELVMMVVAFSIHYVFFRKYQVGGRPTKQQSDGKIASSHQKADGQINKVAGSATPKARAQKAPPSQAAESAQCVAELKVLSFERDLKGAFAAFRGCSDKSSSVYNALVDVCVVCKDVASAEQVMSEAISAGKADVVTFNTVIKAHLQAWDLKRARSTLDAMRKAGLKPTTVTFNELVDAAVVMSDIEEAWTLVNEMEMVGVKPSPVTASILLKTMQAGSRTADIERTMAVVNRVEGQMDEVLLGSVVEACVRAGRPDLLTKQLQMQRGKQKIQVSGAHTYGSLIRAYGAVKDPEGAWQAWQEMMAKKIMPTNVTLGCLVEAFVSNGDIDRGHRLLQEQMADERMRPVVNAVAWCSVLKGYSHQKRFQKAWAVYEEMKKEGLEFSVSTYNALIDACARCGEMVKAPALLKEMIGVHVEPNLVTYSSILKGYCQENRLDRAMELLEYMKTNTRFRPDEVTYNTLLDGCARQNLYDKGIAILGEMEQAGVRPSNFTLSVVVKLAGRGRKLQNAFALTERLSTQYRFKPNIHVYNNLIQACFVNQNAARAINVFGQLLGDKLKPDERTYALLLRGCASIGMVSDVISLLRAAFGGSDKGQPESAVAKAVTEAIPGGARIRGGLSGDLVSEILTELTRYRLEPTMLPNLLSEMRGYGASVDQGLATKILSGVQGQRRLPQG